MIVLQLFNLHTTNTNVDNLLAVFLNDNAFGRYFDLGILTIDKYRPSRHRSLQAHDWAIY